MPTLFDGITIDPKQDTPRLSRQLDPDGIALVHADGTVQIVSANGDDLSHVVEASRYSADPERWVMNDRARRAQLMASLALLAVDSGIPTPRRASGSVTPSRDQSPRVKGRNRNEMCPTHGQKRKHCGCRA